MSKQRLIREVLVFVSVVGGGIVLIPLMLGALGSWSGQALFTEMVRAFFTYFFHLTLLASLGLYAVVTIIRLLIWGLRQLHGP